MLQRLTLQAISTVSKAQNQQHSVHTHSVATLIGHRINFPAASDTRVMMMPFDCNSPTSTLPNILGSWKNEIVKLLAYSGLNFPEGNSIGYITIDQGLEYPGRTLRRPGAHCDGKGTWGGATWGGGDASDEVQKSVQAFLAKFGENIKMSGKGSGCLLATRIINSEKSSTILYSGAIKGNFGYDGDAAHLTSDMQRTTLPSSQVAWLDPYAIHEAVMHKTTQFKQILRISLPSKGAWYEGYTRNPLGVQPAGEILKERSAQMNYGK